MFKRSLHPLIAGIRKILLLQPHDIFLGEMALQPDISLLCINLPFLAQFDGKMENE